MNQVVENAIIELNEVMGLISYNAYSNIFDGLTEIETLSERDAELEELWAKWGDAPMDPETECIEEPFLQFHVGTHREKIWRWFDQRHSTGVYHLLYGGGRTCIVTECCPHCGREVELRWDTREDGYKAFCPYCGGRLMLCDECKHSGADGEFRDECDYDSKTDTCKHNCKKERMNYQ